MGWKENAFTHANGWSVVCNIPTKTPRSFALSNQIYRTNPRFQKIAAKTSPHERRSRTVAMPQPRRVMCYFILQCIEDRTAAAAAKCVSSHSNWKNRDLFNECETGGIMGPVKRLGEFSHYVSTITLHRIVNWIFFVWLWLDGQMKLMS